jgi:hypothetical protein
MNVHKNARLTPSGRVLLVQRIEQGWSVRERTAYRWLDRYRAGDRVLHDRSSAPHRCRHRLAAMQVSRIEQLRRQRMTGPAIARSLGLARSTVGLVLRRLGLNRLAWLDPRPATNGSGRANRSISTSRPWAVSTALATGSRVSTKAIIAPEASATNTCMSPSTMPRASPMSNCCPAWAGMMPPGSSTGHWPGTPSWAPGLSG